MKKNVAGQVVVAQMINATTGAAFSGSVTAYVLGDGGTQSTGSVGSGACTSEGNGVFSYAPAQAETNFDHIAFTFIGTGAIPTTVQVYTNFPQTADNATNISAIKTKTDSLTFTVANVLDANTLRVGGTTQTARDIGASVLLSSGTGTGQLSLSSGAVLLQPTQTGVTIPTVTNLTNAPTAGDFTATMKTSIGTAVAASAVASVTGNVGGNVTGSVGSVATGGIANTSFAANAIDAAALAADAGTEIATAVWASGTRTLSAGTNIVLAKGTGITGFNDLSAAAVNAEVDTAIADVGLTTTITGRIDVATSTRLASASYTAPLDAAGVRSAVGLASANLDTQIDALPTAAENTTAVWAAGTRVLTAGTNIVLAKGTGVTGFNDLDAAGVRSAVGLATANLDTQIATLATASSLATVAGYVDTEVAAIKVTTDKLDTALEADGGVYRFTTNALEQGPSGSGPSAADIADAVWDESISGHLTGGTTGAALNAAGSAGDPWSTLLPGAYSSGTAGYLIGTNIDAPISTAGGGLDAAGVRAALGLASANLDTQLGDLPTAAENTTAVWAAGARTLTAIDEDSTTLDLEATIRGAMGLASANLDTQIGTLATATNLTAVKTVTDKLDDTLELDGADYRFTANALEEAPTDGSAPSASAIADEVQTRTIAGVTLVSGLAANSITAAAAAADFVAEVQSGLATASALATVDSVVDAVKAKTDNLPADPADASDIAAGLAALSIPTVADIWDEALDGAVTARESMRLQNSALAGKASGLETTSVAFRDLADTKDRITATVTADGNRTAVTTDLT